MVNLVIILILLSSLPVGYLLAYLCKDELVVGRKYFLIIGILSLIASWISVFFSFSSKIVVILTLIYFVIISFIAAWKSYDSKFIKNGDF